MKHVIIGTAGHVDHGKTALIQALTGTNTDRLKEEQDRGMTIDIGFASLKLPDGTVAGIVDVPGHERFLKNMLAGATGVDVALLVVAADEGIMPQTEEHLEILRLLEVKNGVVALTKCDITDREWQEVVEEDIRLRLKGSFLSSAPIVRVSSVTHKGLDALKRALMSAVSRSEARSSAMPARLPIDRAFTRSGFGTVVTGTLVAGALHVGDSIQIVPQMIASRVRGLQVHNEKVQRAEAGSRVAVNLAGVETADLGRGAQLVAPGAASACTVLDAHYTVSALAAPLKDRARIRMHIGTDEVIGRITLLDSRRQLMPGESGFVQLKGECPFAAMRGDRFIIRSFSPMLTIGGGRILDTSPLSHKKSNEAVIESLETMLRGTPTDLVRALLNSAEYGTTFIELQTALNLPQAELELALQTLSDNGEVVLFGKDRAVSAVLNSTLLDRAVTILTGYHAKFPLRAGMPKEELRTTVAARSDSKQFGAQITLWESEGEMRTDAGLILLPDFEVELNERQLGLLARIEAYYIEKGIAVPTVQEVSTMVETPIDAVSALLKVGVDRGIFHYVADGIYYAAATIETLKSLIREFINIHKSISVGEFRDITESNRKFSLQALEYLDAIRFTLRNVDVRTLADSIG